ncbi:DnaJ domain protein [Trichuris suis]|nr:DnaJ domain protein [Trichuris suis]
MEGVELDMDYYSFMNIRKDATPAEIGQAFRRLSLIYHPDRHTDPVLRARSQELFDKVRKMYEVLIDPHRREIYDAVGEKGLELSGWEIIERRRSPEEVVAEYTRLQKLYELDMMQESTNPKGSFTLHTSMSHLFDGDLRSIFGNALIVINGMTLAQSVQLPVNSKNQFTLGGKLECFNGVGEGLLSLKFHSDLSKRMRGDVTLEYNGEARCGARLSHIFFDVLVVSVNVSTPTFVFNPSYDLSIDFSRPLAAKCIGVLTMKFGSQCSVTTSLNFSTLGKNNLMIGCLVGVPSSMLMAAYVHHFGCSGSNLQTSVKLVFPHQPCPKASPTLLQNWDNGCHCRLHLSRSNHPVYLRSIYVSSLLSIGRIRESQVTTFVFSSSSYCPEHHFAPCTVALTNYSSSLRLRRGRQVYETNVSLAEREFPVKAILTGMLISVFCRGMFNYLLKPLFHKIKDKLSNGEENPESAYSKQKRDFELSVALMSQEAKRMQAMEAERQGLVITAAWYGCFHSNSTPDKIIDVTYAVQLLVRDSKLIVFGTQSKSILNGFFDPCPGRQKKLKINYLFRGVTHEHTFDDNEPIVLPKRAHLSPLASERSR